MKKNRFRFLIIAIALMLCFGLGGVFCVNTYVYAETTEIDNAVFQDSGLYRKLCELYATLNNTSLPSALYADSLTDIKLGENAGDKIETLDLSQSNITSISGLEYFDFANVKVLILDDNDITSISSEDLFGFTNLEEIRVRNNGLESIDLSTKTKLKTALLGSNELSSINLNKTSAEALYADLSNNMFLKFSDIKINSTTNYSLSVMGNYITDFDTQNENILCDIGMQYMTTSYTVDTLISYYEMAINNGYLLKVNRINDDETLTLVDTKTSGGEAFSLSSGNYVVSYVDANGDNLYDDRDISDISDSVTLNQVLATYMYKDYSFTVRPNLPKMKIVFKGKEYDTLTETVVGRPSIKITTTENINYLYQVANGDWKTLSGDTIDLSKYSGRYIVHIKATENGIESESLTIMLSTSAVSFLPDIVLVAILILVLLGATTLISFLIKKYLR